MRQPPIALFRNKPLPNMVSFRTLILKFFTIYLFGCALSKIVLPHKLRYLENMLNAEVVAKAAKIRQRIESNPNIQENEKSWPLLLAKYQADDNLFKNNIKSGGYGLYNRHFNNRI
ncbi:hypothetical protein O3G_MSEX000007 [Manduca sexta]|nr:hypothetical protein O3G_MSEX000007 [Manduca sexta]